MDQDSLQALLSQLHELPGESAFHDAEQGSQRRGTDDDQKQEQQEAGESAEEAGVKQEGSTEQAGDTAEVVDVNPELARLLGSLSGGVDDGVDDSSAPNESWTASQYESWYNEDTGHASTGAAEYEPAGASSRHHQHHIGAEARDIRKLTYVQALPILSRLAADQSFIDALQELKSAQETLELSLLDQRNRTKADLEKQLKKAQESGGASRQYEINRVGKLLTATMTKFDKAALQSWDTLARDQQARLEQLGVPCFFVIKQPDPVAQERQRRVMETLVTLLEDA